MKHSNDEHIETAHSVVNKRERQINAQSTRDYVSPEKRKRSHRLITVHNSYNKSFVTTPNIANPDLTDP